MLRAFLFCLVLALSSRGETLDEAVRSLAKKISARMTAGEVARVTVRNLSQVASVDASRARATFERALRRTAPRTTQSIEVTLTFSRNLRESLVVAELLRNGESAVEIAAYRPDVTGPARRAAIEKHLLWEQESPMLDVVIADERMIVLEPARLAVFTRRGSSWEQADARALTSTAAVRDSRGRLLIDDTTVTAILPGAVCRGTWKPAGEITCESSDAMFSLAGESVKLSPGRNTLEAAGWPPFFAYARADDQARLLYVLSELDGRIHLYDSDKKPAGSFASWGSDFLSLDNGCRQVLATGDREGNDVLAAYDIVDRRPVQASDIAEFPGPVTALWPAANGALAIAHNLATGRYAAYSITIDCSH